MARDEPRSRSEMDDGRRPWDITTNMRLMIRAEIKCVK